MSNDSAHFSCGYLRSETSPRKILNNIGGGMIDLSGYPRRSPASDISNTWSILSLKLHLRYSGLVIPYPGNTGIPHCLRKRPPATHFGPVAAPTFLRCRIPTVIQHSTGSFNRRNRQGALVTHLLKGKHRIHKRTRRRFVCSYRAGIYGKTDRQSLRGNRQRFGSYALGGSGGRLLDLVR